MSYRNFKRSLREETVKDSQKEIERIEEFRNYIFKIGSGEFSQDKLQNINESYNLGLEEVTPKTVKDALEKLIKALECDLKDNHLILKSVDNDFNTRVNNLPLFMLSLLSTSNIETIHYISQIFKKHILADNKDCFDIVTYEGEDYPKLRDYETRLKDLLSCGKIDEFNEVALEYFDYFLSFGEIKKLLEKIKISLDDIRAWFKGMLEIERLETITLPNYFCSDVKGAVHRIKYRLEDALKSSQEIYDDMRKADGNNKWDKLHMSLKYKSFFELDAVKLDYNMLVEFIHDFKEGVDKEIPKLVELESAVTKNGINKPVPSLPRLIFECFQVTDIPALFGYLIITGLKYNGMVKRPISDKVEVVIHPLEVELAGYIQNDFSIKREDKGAFLNLFKVYLFKYIDNFECVYGDIPLKLKIPFIIDQLNMYIDSFSDFRDFLKEDEEKSQEPTIKKETIPEVVEQESRIDAYLRNYQETGIGTLEEFEELLVSEGLDEEASNKYLTQMMNAMDEYEKNKLRNKRVQVLINNSLEDNITLYDIGLNSSYVDAKLLMNELNTILDLLENAREEEKDDLVSTLWEYFAVLRDLVAPTYLKTKNGVNRNLIYFKDESQVPYLFKAISNLEDSLCARDAMDMIMTDNIYAASTIEGDYPVKIKAMGKGFKIFYTMVGNNVIIINGGLKEISFEEILSIVNSREFLEFMKGLNFRIKNDFNPNEEAFTNMILEELNKPRGKK